MESAAEFTAVPGWGGVAMGVTALGGTALAARQPPASLVGGVAGRSICRRRDSSCQPPQRKHAEPILLFSTGPGRKFVLSFAPPIFVGGLLTLALFQLGAMAALPGVWLLLYGTAIVTGGAFSVRAVPIMGLCLMSLGQVLYLRRHNGETTSWRQDLAWCILHLGSGLPFDTGAEGAVKKFTMAKSSTARQEQYHARRRGPSAVRSVSSEPVSASLDRLIHERIRLGIVSASR